MTANNTTTLNQDSTPEEYAALLKGRHVTDTTDSSDEASATITLDNSTTLELIRSRGTLAAETRQHTSSTYSNTADETPES